MKLHIFKMQNDLRQTHYKRPWFVMKLCMCNMQYRRKRTLKKDILNIPRLSELFVSKKKTFYSMSYSLLFSFCFLFHYLCRFCIYLDNVIFAKCYLHLLSYNPSPFSGKIIIRRIFKRFIFIFSFSFNSFGP